MMAVEAMEGAPWIGCVQAERGQVTLAMYNCGGGSLGRYLRQVGERCGVFGM